jgi:hypothetical protein
MSIMKQGPAISEARLQLLVPRRLKASLRQVARARGLSVGEYVRRLIDVDLRRSRAQGRVTDFPFGQNPIRTGRRHGSTDHDRAR